MLYLLPRNWIRWFLPGRKVEQGCCQTSYWVRLIAMEALDQLLMACHSQSIKPFVESFLHMVAKLLESGEPKLQVLGTNSFVKFANIEEDTPSYHRRYDFLYLASVPCVTPIIVIQKYEQKSESLESEVFKVWFVKQ